MKKDQQGDRAGRLTTRVMNRIKERFFLRFHMSLILLATVLSGLLATKLLLLAQVNNIVIRYPLAVLFAYLTFFLFVKLWLLYMSASHPFRKSDKSGAAGDVLSSLPDLSGGGGSPGGGPTFSGGGGGSGGAGASAVFDGPVTRLGEGAMQSTSGAARATSRIAGGAGDFLSGIFDDDSFVLIVLGVLFAVIFGSAVYLVYLAPHILSEAAFDFLLATSLVRSYRKMNKPDWIGSVFHDTYKPFLVVLVIATAAAWLLHSRFPDAVKMSDLFANP